jgi:abortive infection bacteriophage resistance protein
MYPFQHRDGSHNFKNPISFQDIIDHYRFDKKLRFLLLDAIERIEVALRANFCNSMSMAYGPHWYLDGNLFNNVGLHTAQIAIIKEYCSDCSELFIKQYNAKYTNPPEPPGWMVMETLTFGTLSTLFENLKDNDQKKHVAAVFGTVVPILESWLKSFNFVRNCCAHHSRLWNRRLPLKPTLPNRKGKRFLKNIDDETNKRLYGVMSCILYVLNKINPNSGFKQKFKSLLGEFPIVNTSYMGFPSKWKDEDLWNN